MLQLNPNVPLASATTWRLFVALELFYGVHLAVLFYLLMVGREFIGLDAISPGWISVRVLAWLTAASSAVASALMWLNVGGLSAAVGETAVRRMTAGAAATTATAHRLAGVGGGALFVRAAREPRRCRAAGDRRLRLAGAADCRSRAGRTR